jgi:SAM-dependent methyltransferase
MVHHLRCPLCSSELIAVHFSCTDHLKSKEAFDIARCNNCGFLFTQDYPDEKDISEYYESEDYISHTDTSTGLLNKIYHLARQVMLIRKRGIIRRLTGLNGGKLLDVGSGTGHFAAMMKKSGWTVRGIEINEKARNYSESAFGLDIIGPDSMASLEEKSFDCVTMWHVLEHFHDPQKYLSDLVSLLKPGGICLIALPNSSSFDAGYYGRFWAAFDVPRHLWHFDPDTFNLFSVKLGMKSEQRLVLPFDVFYISVLSEKYRGSLLPIIKGICMGTWFSLQSVFSRKGCSSLVYVLRKSLD